MGVAVEEEEAVAKMSLMLTKMRERPFPWVVTHKMAVTNKEKGKG